MGSSPQASALGSQTCFRRGWEQAHSYIPICPAGTRPRHFLLSKMAWGQRAQGRALMRPGDFVDHAHCASQDLHSCCLASLHPPTLRGGLRPVC